jgi:hypothetical protein
MNSAIDLYNDEKVANRDGVSDRSRGVSRRPPIPFYTIVARTGGYTYAVGVWGLSIVNGHSLSRRAKPERYDFATFSSAVRGGSVTAHIAARAPRKRLRCRIRPALAKNQAGTKTGANLTI